MTTIFQTLNAQVFQPIANFFESGLKVLEGDLLTLLQQGQADLVTAENNAAAALTAAQAKVDTVINPVVDNFLKAGAAAIEASVPGLAPIIAAGEPPAETAINGVTDAVLVAMIGKLATLLSSAAKTTAAVQLSNMAGAL